MKITKTQLKQIIKEELSSVLSEDPRQRHAVKIRKVEKCRARADDDADYYAHWPKDILADANFMSQYKKGIGRGYAWKRRDHDYCAEFGPDAVIRRVYDVWRDTVRKRGYFEE